ncbi:MAG: hypothetical protein JJLCMIEE_01018 [Acidimicrobiales bacterium]|nr:MAG: dienelactone hydrolase [Actinomycetota bacterium]MBV6507960.1 hypothetical protein [Acidimicrobiales bacterium]RIK06934.1 MAG: dienelactone hydrolase [Acidobacteriota bacterium]
MAADDLSDFEVEEFSHRGSTRDVYRKGEGPAVVVMAEIPGITPAVARFARTVADSGLSVYLPHLFGEPGREPSAAYSARSMIPACVSREFKAFARGRTEPVSTWLRALARHAHEVCGGPGVGALGMCFTGGFALGMMVDDAVLAPVLSQPSLPLGFTRRKRADLHLSPEDLTTVKERAEDDDICVLGLRFSHDRLSPPERFESLRRELGERFIGVEIDSGPGNPHGLSRTAHSVLTEELVDDPDHPTWLALQQVLDFFTERLLPG